MGFNIYRNISNSLKFNCKFSRENIYTLSDAQLLVRDLDKNIIFTAKLLASNNEILRFEITDSFSSDEFVIFDLILKVNNTEMTFNYDVHVNNPTPVMITNKFVSIEVDVVLEKVTPSGLYNFNGLQPLNGGNEKDFLRYQFTECANIYGTLCDLFIVDKLELNVNADPILTYKQPLRLKVLFDDRPKIRTLQSLGWYHSDMEIIPLLVHIPRKTLQGVDIKLLQWSYIRFYNLLDESNETEFLLSKFRSSDLFPIFWMASLVPKLAVYDKKITIDGEKILDRIQPDIPTTPSPDRVIVEYNPNDKPKSVETNPIEPSYFKY